MKEVPSVQCYVGKCIAGFSSNCLHTLSNSATNEAQLDECIAGFSSICLHTLSNSATNEAQLDKCIAGFSWNCAQPLLNYEDGIPVCETGRKATKVSLHSIRFMINS